MLRWETLKEIHLACKEGTVLQLMNKADVQMFEITVKHWPKGAKSEIPVHKIQLKHPIIKLNQYLGRWYYIFFPANVFFPLLVLKTNISGSWLNSYLLEKKKVLPRKSMLKTGRMCQVGINSFLAININSLYLHTWRCAHTGLCMSLWNVL